MPLTLHASDVVVPGLRIDGCRLATNTPLESRLNPFHFQVSLTHTHTYTHICLTKVEFSRRDIILAPTLDCVRYFEPMLHNYIKYITQIVHMCLQVDLVNIHVHVLVFFLDMYAIGCHGEYFYDQNLK